MSAPLLRCEGLVVGHAGRAVLPPIDLVVPPATLWAVVGRNGAGKTTWMRTVLGLLPPLAGAARLADDAHPAYVPQRTTFDALHPLTVAEVVAGGMLRGAWGWPGRGSADRVRAALDDVGAAELARRPFRSLSEGQKQRVLLARLIASRARVAFLDEPTAAMDPVAEATTLQALARLRDAHDVGVLVVTHRVEAVAAVADGVILLDPELTGAVTGPPGEVLEDPRLVARLGRVAWRRP